MIKIQNKQVIEEQDWSAFVSETYNRPYRFQQQDGCQDRGMFELTVPSKAEDHKNDTIPEKVNGEEMGVSFKAWLERDPKQPIVNQKHDYQLELFWTRNFYPDIQMVANDLHEKGLLPAGEYIINIDW